MASRTPTELSILIVKSPGSNFAWEWKTSTRFAAVALTLDEVGGLQKLWPEPSSKSAKRPLSKLGWMGFEAVVFDSPRLTPLHRELGRLLRRTAKPYFMTGEQAPEPLPYPLLIRPESLDDLGERIVARRFDDTPSLKSRSLGSGQE